MAQQNIKLLYKAKCSFFPSAFEAHFYGAADNCTYAIWQRPYVTPTGMGRVEFVIEKLFESKYEWKNEKLLIQVSKETWRTPLLPGAIDKYDQKTETIKVCRICKTIGQAETLLNSLIKVPRKRTRPAKKKPSKMIRRKPPKGKQAPK